MMAVERRRAFHARERRYELPESPGAHSAGGKDSDGKRDHTFESEG